VRKIPHAGGEAAVLVKNLAFGAGVAVMGDFLFVSEAELVKSGAKATVQYEPDAFFGNGRWISESWSETRKGDTRVVLGRERGREWNDGFWGEPRSFMYKYLPGGIIHARRFKFKFGYIPEGSLGLDDECLYYTAKDRTNTWFYAMPWPPT
jgi:hypothetical protein